MVQERWEWSQTLANVINSALIERASPQHEREWVFGQNFENRQNAIPLH